MQRKRKENIPRASRIRKGLMVRHDIFNELRIFPDLLEILDVFHHKLNDIVMVGELLRHLQVFGMWTGGTEVIDLSISSSS